MLKNFTEQDNIIALLGIESLPVEKRIAIVEEATELVELRVLQKALGSLTEEAQKTFVGLLENKDEQIYAFMVEQGIDVQRLIEEEIATVRQELLVDIQEE